jgi:hypothetical protein
MTDDLIGRTSEWLRACSTWLLTNDLDMKLPGGVLDTDPLDLADALEALRPTVPEGYVLSEDVFREGLRALIRPRGIAKWSAERLLCDEQVGAFLRGRRPPEPKLLEAIGVERVVTYRVHPDSPLSVTPTASDDIQSGGVPVDASASDAGVPSYPVEERAFHVVRRDGPDGTEYRARDRATLSSFPADNRQDAYSMARSLNQIVAFHVQSAARLSGVEEMRKALELAVTIARRVHDSNPGETDYRRGSRAAAMGIEAAILQEIAALSSNAGEGV